VDLASRLVHGQAAPAPYAFDPTNGVNLVGAGFDPGPSSAGVVSQPTTTTRFSRATFRWRGGKLGIDRPVGRAFVSIERRRGRRWVPVTNDLGLRIIWTVDPDGVYTAQWEVPLFATRGTHRFVITANRYRLESAPFQVRETGSLALRRVSTKAGYLAVELDYPQAVSRSADDAPLAWRPAQAAGGSVTFDVGGRRVTVRRKRSGVFAVKAPRGPVSVAAAGASDRYGNHPGAGLQLRG
jgi:hypothetical protein